MKSCRVQKRWQRRRVYSVLKIVHVSVREEADDKFRSYAPIAKWRTWVHCRGRDIEGTNSRLASTASSPPSGTDASSEDIAAPVKFNPCLLAMSGSKGSWHPVSLHAVAMPEFDITLWLKLAGLRRADARSLLACWNNTAQINLLAPLLFILFMILFIW